MKITFLSNYFNHHQAAFCRAMYDRLGEDFCFIQTEEMEAERLQMGWSVEEAPVFLKKSYGEPLAETECIQTVDSSDVVILGTAPEHLIRNRIRAGKLIVRYSERPLKKGLEVWKYPYRYIKWHKNNPKHAKIYLLCASAYAASDFAKLGLFKDKCYKWGYFPEVKKYDDIDVLIGAKEPNSILWVARLIELKHPEYPIYVAKRLKEEGYDFKMNLIGGGILEDKLRAMIGEYGLEDCVKLLGSMKPEQVREHMERSQIFLFTSDRNEGWGAVLNESMNSGCAVVANRAIGAAPFLICDNKNGLVYPDGDTEALYLKVKMLLEDREKAARLGKQAYETMVSEWNAECAAERLLILLDELRANGSSNRFYSGPCSRAEIRPFP